MLVSLFYSKFVKNISMYITSALGVPLSVYQQVRFLKFIWLNYTNLEDIIIIILQHEISDVMIPIYNNLPDITKPISVRIRTRCSNSMPHVLPR